MDGFDRILHRATADGVLPGTCVIAADKTGTILHSASSGTYINSSAWQAPPLPAGTSAHAEPLTDAPAVAKPFGPDTVCWIASMTKLLTTICVMQCVEQGLLDLDDDVATTVLPELGDVQVLVRMEKDAEGQEKPVLRAPEGKITLRALLTHSSGISYEFTHRRLHAWRQWNNRDLRARGIQKTHADRTEVSRAYRVPLVFDPETSWTYGYGIDWAGVAVERAGQCSLEAFMRRHIFEPLRMRDTTFEPTSHPHLAARIAGMTVRDGARGTLVAQARTATRSPIGGVRHAGGSGLASTARDYIQVLISLLANDAKLLRPATVRHMFQPHLRHPAHLQTMHAHPESFGLAGNIPPHIPVDFGLGGILNRDRIPDTGRSAGAMQWGGYPNLFWWINPHDGICGCYFSQLVPPGDVQSFDMYKRFERAVNETFVVGEGSEGGSSKL